MTDPIEQVTDAHKLEAQGLIILFEIWTRSGGRIYMKNNNDVTWQGHLYEGTTIQMTGYSRRADGQASRPQLQVVNPGGVFGPLIRDGEMDRAQVFKIEVLKEHVDADVGIYRRMQWTIGRVVALVANKGISFELRAITDGVNFILPKRQYIPPQFPFVSLQ
jgi:lambda family phage minor tail protein L